MVAGNQGYPTTRNMPAPYVVRRRVTATVAAAAPQLVNLRLEEWSGRSPRLKSGDPTVNPGYADQVDASRRAALVQVNVNVEAGVLRYLEQDVDSDYSGSATPTVLFTSDYRVEDDAFRFWYHTDGALATFEIEIWFDVPFVPEAFT